ncbi:MAG: flagellar export protein FliJ [Pseudobdellovibrionaceae bacterium]
MKFKFSLQKVLQHRKILEDLAQREFQEAMAELNKQLLKMNEMKEAVAAARDQAFRRQSEGGKTSPALVQVDDFIRGQDIRMESQKKKIIECESLVENLREILRQKAIDYKIIEELKEKQFKDYKIERRKREQKVVDDINLMRFGREDNEK